MFSDDWTEDAIKSIGDRREVFNDEGEREESWAWSVSVEIDGEQVDIEVCTTDSAWHSRHPDLEQWIRDRLSRVGFDNESSDSRAQQLKAASPLWLTADEYR